MKFTRKIIMYSTIVIFILIINVAAATSISSANIPYDNTKSGSTKTNVKDALDDLYSNSPIAFKIGDYVKMTPTKTSFVLPKTLTGYSEDQTINSGELNLWRIIKVNDDKTAEAVSEYISSSSIAIGSKNGYLNYVGTLNYIATQYENEKYTAGSRHMGYDNQTEYITDTSKIICPAWTSSTSSNTNEILGGGDISYTTDTTLVKNALGTLKAYKVGTTSSYYYWLASRLYTYENSNCYWKARGINENGELTWGYLYYNENSTYLDYINYVNIRPIIILKSGIKATGNGTKNTPYILS